MQSQIEKHLNLKNVWMATHVTEAEFPTPLSKRGLELYQEQQLQQSSQTISSIPAPSTHALTIYPVDCHPLTIRYSLVFASKWQDGPEKEAVIEFLTQIMLDDDSPAQLFVGFLNGKPAACGIIFQSENNIALVSDVHALPLANQQALIEEMENTLLSKVLSEKNELAIISRC